MYGRAVAIGLIIIAFGSTLALAQAATPTPLDSNVGMATWAQTHGQDLLNNTCSLATRGGNGCGGCYPHTIPTGNALVDLLAQLSDVNPEWAPIAPMISGMDDEDLSPLAAPVVVTGTIGLSKSPGDDFSGTHMTADYNAEIIPDNNGRLATGNTNERVEFEWEGNKLPMFAWSGEGDQMIAVGRWIFDCGHPDPTNLGTCSNNASKSCLSSTDCATCSGTCSNNASQSCTADEQCATCNGVNFAVQSEMHPPQAVAVIRNKALKVGHVVPATQADVYISNDGGGAGDRCIVTHLASSGALLSSAKSCFLHHCSKTTDRNCTVDKDCAGGETCLDLDPALRLADVNAPNFNHCSLAPKACSVDTDCPSGETCVQMANFEFDMPLPPPPSSSATLKTKYTARKPKGSGLVMPKPILTAPTPPLPSNPSLHVLIPMTTMIGTKMPNVFGGTISAGWKEDTTPLTHVQVKLLSLTINNPLKDNTPALQHQCTNTGGGLSGTSCTTNKDCAAVATGLCSDGVKSCQVDADCPKTMVCSGGSQCVGGTIPGWDLWAEVNGDWIKFAKLDTIGAQKPFASAPYVQPSPTPGQLIKKTYAFDEYVPPTGDIHIKASGHSLNCLKTLFGHDLVEGLNTYGLIPGATCLGAVSKGVGIIDVTHTGPTFTAPPDGASCITPAKGPTICTATSIGGEGGTCSVTTNQLCASDADCPAKHCSNDATKACSVDTDCGSGNSCGASPETCNGRCSNDNSISCHQNSDCGAGNDCQFGDFTLQYSIQVK